MNLVTVSNEHTIDTDLLAKDGWILDVGCRFFDLSAEFARLGCQVLALDPSLSVVDRKLTNVKFLRSALVGDKSVRSALFCDSNDAAHLVHGHRNPTHGVPQYTVPCVTVEDLLCAYLLNRFEVVKLDCEGAEFDILSRWPGPVATQITCAFHDFVNPAWCRDAYPALLNHLSQWYTVVQHQSYVRHGHPTPCFWDSLFVLKPGLGQKASLPLDLLPDTSKK